MKHIRHTVFGEAFEGSCQSARLGLQSPPSALKFNLAEAQSHQESPNGPAALVARLGQWDNKGSIGAHTLLQLPNPALWWFSGGLAPWPSLVSGRKRLQLLLGRRGLLFGALCAVQNLGNELGDFHAAGRVLLQERHVQQLGVGGPLCRLLLQAEQKRQGEKKRVSRRTRRKDRHIRLFRQTIYNATFLSLQGY